MGRKDDAGRVVLWRWVRWSSPTSALVCFLLLFELVHVLMAPCTPSEGAEHLVTPPPTAPPTRAPLRRSAAPLARRDVAFCVHSIRFHTLALTGSNFSRFLVDPLDADVFAAGESKLGAPEAVLDAFGDRVVSMHFQEQVQFNSMKMMISNFPEYQLYSNWSRGNNAYHPGPVMQMYWVNMCENLITAHEVKRGYPYKWKIYSRTDYLWLAPHPPLELLQKDDVVWVPDTGRYGGIQPLTLTCQAKYCDVFARVWDSLISKNYYKVMRKFQLSTARHVNAESCNTEKMHHSWVVANGLQAWGYRSVGHIRCGGIVCTASDKRFCHFSRPCREVENQVWKYRKAGAQAETNAEIMLNRAWDAKEDFVVFPYHAAYVNGMCIPKVGCMTTKKGDKICVA